MIKENTRKARPAHEVEVDKMLFKYVDYKKGLEYQRLILGDLQASMETGRRTIPIYERLEGIGGEMRVQEEDIVIRINLLENKIEKMEAYIKSVEGLIEYAFKGNEEQKTFVYWYWLYPDMPRDIRSRRRIVVDAMRYLTYNSFYDWRGKIYLRLAEAAGIEI